MIEIKNVNKSYEEGIKILDGISLSIEKGCIYGLVGRSGAGKSTLLRCINGLESYDSGQIVVNGKNVENLKSNEMREFRKNLGMIFQHYSLAERLTVYDNIALPMKWWKYSKKEIDERVTELLKLVNLEDKRNVKPRHLSGGQKQRVAIARALTMNPEILLCVTKQRRDFLIEYPYSIVSTST